MADISFFALGGLDEKEKKCFVLEVDKEFFIFNIGISIPNFSRLGIKKIVPDYTWVEKNRNKIKGIFISNANFNNVGGMLYTNKILNNIPIYSSKIGKIIIENFFNKRSMKNTKNYSNYIINEVKPLEKIKIGNLMITPFSIFNSSPNSLGFIFDTKDGAIIILDDFMIGADKLNEFNNQIYEINKITNNKNLILISSIGNVAKEYGFTSPKHEVIHFIENEININDNRRHFISCYDSDLFSIIKIIKLAQKLQINISIYNNVLYNLILKFISLNIIDNKNILFTPITKVNAMERGIVLVAYNKQKLFHMINTICTNNDNFIKLKKTDKFILAFPTTSGFESIEYEVIDLISSLDIEWSKLPKEILEMKASSEDHKILLNFIKPKYIIPTSGLYYEFIEYRNILLESSFKKEDIFLLENGQEIHFENGQYNKSKNKWIEIQEKYVGSSQEIENISDSLLNERKLMSENGVVFISALIKKTNNEYNVSEVKINTFGITIDKLVFKNEINDLEKSITDIINNGFSERDRNTKEIKNSIKKITSKFYERHFWKTPLVLSTLIDR